MSSRKFSQFFHDSVSFFRVNIRRPIKRRGRRFVVNPRLGYRRVRKLGEIGRHVFFGYYDVSPFSGDGNLLLAARGPMADRAPTGDTSLEIGVYDLRSSTPDFRVVGDSSTWCWQQGCRLQWYPFGSSHTILYNRLVNDRYGCVVQDVRTGRMIDTFCRPVYAVSTDGRWGLSLNFSRLHRLRPGYGYAALLDDSADAPVPVEDGLWRIDMQSGDTEFLFSIAEIACMQPLRSMTGAEHYFNHVQFNPSSTRFLFFHLWLNKGRRFSRLITCDVDGEDRYVLINEGHVSHYAWKSDVELLAYSTHADTGTRYHLYRDKSGVRSVVGEGVLVEDGHPSYSPDGSLLLVDTYPDRLREQHVLLYGPERQTSEWVAAFFSPRRFDTTDVRCDLHPRWSHCGRYICVDSACEGKRAMYILDVGDFLSETPLL